MNTPISPAFAYDDDGDAWSALTLWLTRKVRSWVLNAALLCWRGEEEAITEDIVATTIMRIYERLKKVSLQQAEPIGSMTAFARKTARNCFIDQLRKDRRKMRLSQFTDDDEQPVIADNQPSMEEAVHERLFREQLMTMIAQEISHFPVKQREAFLKDQARSIEGLADPASLLRIYLDAGIRLLDYRSQAPRSKVERSRHSSLLHHAHKRLSHSPPLKKFLL
jgi:DNA-directed RNA polymerase specialized sigma24 family protein